jgi:hypothetical protein
MVKSELDMACYGLDNGDRGRLVQDDGRSGHTQRCARTEAPVDHPIGGCVFVVCINTAGDVPLGSCMKHHKLLSQSETTVGSLFSADSHDRNSLLYVL